MSEEELSALTIADIKAIAADLGYTITATLKADIIAEFLEQQALDNQTTPDEQTPSEP